MSPEECSSVINIVEKHHTEKLGGIWGTVRCSSVKTTDVAVEDIPALRPWLLALLHFKLYPLLSAAFPVLADGSTLIDQKTGTSRMRVHDAFIVRYDAVNDQSLSLPEHCDTSSMSIIFALNEEDKTDDYCRDNDNHGQNNDNYCQNYESQHSSQQHPHPQSQSPSQSQSQSQRNRGEERDYLRGSGLRDYKGGGTWFEALDQNSSSRFGSSSSSNSNPSSNYHPHSGSGFSSSSIPSSSSSSIPSSGSSSSSSSGSEFSSSSDSRSSSGSRGLVVNADIGQAVLFAGPLKHAGYPISRGIRNILVLFLYVEGFHYGPYLKESRSKVQNSEKEKEKEKEKEIEKEKEKSSIQNLENLRSEISNGEGVENENVNVNKKVKDYDDDVVNVLSDKFNEQQKERHLEEKNKNKNTTINQDEKNSDSGSASGYRSGSGSGSGSRSGSGSGSGASKGGFVVYRQTVDLVSMLEEEEEEGEEVDGENIGR